MDLYRTGVIKSFNYYDGTPNLDVPSFFAYIMIKIKEGDFFEKVIP
jgi:hypothetical protein